MPSPTQTWGAHREHLAEAALVEAGYSVVERNWRGGGSEIDRIAWKDGLLCFIEVRARSTDIFGLPSQTVQRPKQKRLVRAASAYLARFPPGHRPMARFDVVSIVDRGPEQVELAIIPDAFDLTALSLDNGGRFL